MSAVSDTPILTLRSAIGLCAPLIGIVVITAILVPPSGDYPLNDDWIYAKTVEGILETGGYEQNPYADPIYVVHAYWGALFCSLFGFSFTVLRVSTIFLGALGACAGALCGRACGLSRSYALLLGTLILANPLVMNLTYTFMTDVPFLTLTSLSGFFFLMWFRKSSPWLILGASVAALAAYYVRQFGVLVPVAFLATLVILIARKRVRVTWRDSLAFSLPWFVAVLLVPYMPEAGEGARLTWDWGALGDSTGGRIKTVLGYFFEDGAYLALFLSPVVVARLLLLIKNREALTRRSVVAWGVLTLVSCYTVFTSFSGRLPGLGNVLYDLGVGPLSFRDMIDEGRIAAPLQLGGVWWLLSVLSLAGVCLFMIDAPSLLSKNAMKRSETPSRADDIAPSQNLFLILWGMAFMAVLLLPAIPVRFDRYFLMGLVPLGILMLKVLAQVRQTPGRVAFAGVGLMYLFSVLSLQDYMAWNAARWEAIDVLRSEHGVSDSAIDGGYEFGGWVMSDTYVESSKIKGKRDFGPKGWWLADDTHAVALRPRKNFEEIDRVSYFSWLGMQTRHCLVLRRTAQDEMLR